MFKIFKIKINYVRNLEKSVSLSRLHLLQTNYIKKELLDISFKLFPLTVFGIEELQHHIPEVS